MLIRAVTPLLAESARGKIASFLTVLLADLANESARRGLRCENCRQCCDFGRAGHRLYVTNLELAWFLAWGGQPRRPVSRCCPYLDPRTGCTIRALRPTGCRAFFCRTPVGGANDLGEAALARIKSFLTAEGWPYCYVEWLEALTALADGPAPREAQGDGLPRR